MDRRAFLSTLAILAAPLVGEAQTSGKVYRLGMLVTWPRLDPRTPPAYHVVPQTLADLGYREGQNLVIEWRHTYGEEERRRREAAAVIQWKPDVVVATGNRETMALRDLSTAVPIVCALCAGVVEGGLADSLARPGGNVTGIETLAPELAVKRLQFTRELVPRLAVLGVLYQQAATAASARAQDMVFTLLETAGRSMSVQSRRFMVTSRDDFDGAFAQMSAASVQAVMILATPLMSSNRQQIIDLAVMHRLPTIHEFKNEVDIGGLASYGVNSANVFRRVAKYVDQILKGAKPAELPIERPTHLELAINLKTAKALGLTIPQSILARADHVIQ